LSETCQQIPMNAEMIVETGCRLHFGLLSTDAARDRSFGGLGVMLESPGWSIHFAAAAQASDSVQADGETQARIQQLLAQLRCNEPFAGQPPLAVTVRRPLVHHAGLGSGTQLAMAVVDGWARFLGLTLANDEVFRLSRRGARSSIGQFGYFSGGFLVDAGHNRPTDQAGHKRDSIVVRMDFPEEWNWWLISPQNSTGLSGEAELKAFREMSPIPQATTDRLASLTLLSILPGIQSRNFPEFARGLHEYGQLVGRHFAAVQGSVFSSPLMGDLARHLMGAGLPCVVQSSWGPTVAVPVTTEIEEEFETAWKKWPPHEKCDRLRTKAMNHRGIVRR
jgi:beta-ribofuranosylaminobenzene 5'-phosphate synthase